MHKPKSSIRGFHPKHVGFASKWLLLISSFVRPSVWYNTAASRHWLNNNFKYKLWYRFIWLLDETIFPKVVPCSMSKRFGSRWLYQMLAKQESYRLNSLIWTWKIKTDHFNWATRPNHQTTTLGTSAQICLEELIENKTVLWLLPCSVYDPLLPPDAYAIKGTFPTLNTVGMV
jgi:hypothetical protein